jgi:hypothetical protein
MAGITTSSAVAFDEPSEGNLEPLNVAESAYVPVSSRLTRKDTFPEASVLALRSRTPSTRSSTDLLATGSPFEEIS